MKIPKADYIFIINSSVLYQEERRGKVSMKVHINYVNHKIFETDYQERK